MLIMNYCRLSIMALVVLFGTTVYADLPLSKYPEFKKLPQFNEYIAGVGHGVFWANIMMQTQNVPPLFCMPGKLAPDDGLIYSLLDQEIRSPVTGIRYKPDTPIELILVRSFVARFPCK